MIKGVVGGYTKSCGCLNGKLPEIGEEHNFLTLLEMSEQEKGKGKFQCKCGNIIETLLVSVRTNRTQSCGCKNRLPPGEASCNAFFSVYRHRAKKDDFLFTLTKNEFKILTSQNCFYCGIAPEKEYRHGKSSTSGYLCNGIDRVNNDEGYTLENSVTCCAACNHAKSTMSKEEFLDMMKKITIKHEKLELNFPYDIII